MSDGKTYSDIFSPPLPELPAALVRWGRLYGAAPALAISAAANRHPKPVIVVCNGAAEAARLCDELRFFAPADLPVSQFPDWETLPYDVFSPHQDIVSERLATLLQIPRLERGVIVVPIATLMQRLPTPEWVRGRSLLLEKGQRLELAGLQADLVAAGYRRVTQVFEHGEFAIRGSLVDLFPMGGHSPIRIDLLDDEIDTLRRFDAETQRSAASVDRVRLLPAHEYPLDEDGIRFFRRRFRQRFEGDPSASQVYQEVSKGNAPGGTEYYLPLFHERMSSLLHYLPAGSLAIIPADLDAALDTAWSEISERYEQRRHDTARPVLSPDEICYPPGELQELFQALPRIAWQPFEWPGTDPDRCHFASNKPPSLNLDPRAAEPAAALRRYVESFAGRILFAAESAGRRETLIEILAGHGISLPACESWQAFIDSSQKLAVTVAAVQQGLQLAHPALALVAEDQLFGERVRQSRRRRRAAREPEQIIRELTDLRAGSPVVHEDYGVGRYLGLVTKTIDQTPLEMLVLEYAGGDKLYVPVHALQLISRYTGGSPDSAPLHRLGGNQWQKIRQKARERIRDVAAELLELYATRESRTGHRCAYDERDYRAFSADFPFEETADQEQAIVDVLRDLRDGKPMDRVVCGDVGFGKTEVALRASFAAVSAGRQVALLVPTTLLAQQHHQTFCDRFADWPVKVEMLSRFRKGKQAREIIAQLKSGIVDIVIGTHRLLQPEIAFANLGLVIIDEEQRFGVRHKERLKSLRAEVDVLTLTATPIPRTLNMALGGLREMSLIATPPAERHAIKTFVSQWDDALIKEACMREVRRGGQIFFVHNEVRTIENMAARLARLLPDLDIRIGHGQMRETELEQVMLDFYHQRFNLLLCTTIIESGLDLPAANTIVINRADKLGLAQLHQLRGRVGRSHHRAYAYLISPPRSTLSGDAARRLEAIEALEELGAGFTLATHDLEIRGAGELLGEEQSGQIHELGFSLYMDMLQKAVHAMRSGQALSTDGDAKPGVEAELRVAALIPEDYLPDVHLRLILYKRIANADSEDALRELQVEMIDRFGLLPAQCKALFRLARIKLRALALGIRRLEASTKTGSVWFSSQTPVEPLTLIQLIRQQPSRYRLDGQDRLRFTVDMPDEESRFAELESLLSLLASGA